MAGQAASEGDERIAIASRHTNLLTPHKNGINQGQSQIGHIQMGGEQAEG